MGAVLALTIRRVRLEDLGDIIAIEDASFPDPWSSKAFLQEVQRNPGGFKVAILRDEVAGYGVARIEVAVNFLGLRSYRRCHLANLAVAPMHREKGIGSRLLMEILQYAQDERVREVYLEVRTKNTLARRFYYKRGFKEAGYMAGYYGDDDGVTMVLKLNSRPLSS